MSVSALERADWRERLRAAFSLRSGVRALFVRSSDRLAPVDGLRALSILWVVIFHSAWTAWGRLPQPIYLELLHARWALPIWRGNYGVDVFFVISGFLIAGMLLDERARTGTVALGLFYVRRILRLWPALAVGVLVHLVCFGERPWGVLATLFYVNDFMPVKQIVIAWSWSLSIEEQFYLVCPWLLALPRIASLRSRLLVVVLSALALVGVAAIIVARGPFFAYDAEIAVDRWFDRWALGYDALYTKPWMRAGALLAGVSAAILHRMPGVRAALARARMLAPIGALLAVAAAATCTHWGSFLGAPRAVEIAYLATFRTVFGASIAYLLLFALSEHPVGRALGRVLSLRALYPIAQLAYSAYLMNPYVADVSHRYFTSRFGSGVEAMAVLVPVDLAATFAAAALLYVSIERPFMTLRPGERASTATRS